MIRLIFKEILHRKMNFLLGLLAVIIAVALSVSFFITDHASHRETARVMLKMGFNLRVIPAHTDMNQFFLTGCSDHTMPEEYLNTLASAQGFSYNHLIGTLQKKISWQGLDIILTGLAPELCPPGHKRPPMIYSIKPGTAYVGYALAQQFNLKKGDTITIAGLPLNIEHTLTENGTIDDFRIQCALIDAQKILNLPRQINEIQAVDCLCFETKKDPLVILRQQITSLLPETQVIQAQKIAQARAQQRQLIKKIFSFILPLVVIVCGIWIAVLALMNVRQRQSEIGLLRALGYGSTRIIFLLLGKAILIGLIGAVAGFFLGTYLALDVGPYIFKITAQNLKPMYFLLTWSLVIAPLFAAVSSFIPVTIAASQDPADVLRYE